MATVWMSEEKLQYTSIHNRSVAWPRGPGDGDEGGGYRTNINGHSVDVRREASIYNRSVAWPRGMGRG